MQTTLDATICVDGNNYQNEESMPENIRQAFEGAVASALKAKRSLFVGRSARFVAKLDSRIVCGGEEFSDVAEMPSDARRAYEDALATIFPGYITQRVAQSEARLQQRNKFLVACASLLATTSYLWVNDCFCTKFLIHFIRFLCGQV